MTVMVGTKIRTRLTGRRRYRLHDVDYVKLLVLQVEEQVTFAELQDPLTAWRDATPEDVFGDTF